MKGKPVVYGTVTFFGSDGVSRVSAIQPDGSYEVKDVAAGETKITIDSPKPNAPEANPGQGKAGRVSGRAGPKDLPSDAPKIDRQKPDPGPTASPEVVAKWAPIDIRYADQGKTPLKFTVRKGPNTYDIQVEP
jgi:hypothetical protein